MAKNPLVAQSPIKSGRVAWQSPSNIALVKYWGKYGDQLPRNPSISFTLSESHTRTEVKYSESTKGLQVDFLFHGRPNELFAERILNYLTKLKIELPFLDQLHLEIRSENSFPHSSGIASSASAFSALALCICSIEHQLFQSLPDDEVFRRKSSRLARLGSGSASRSIFGSAALWGEEGTVESSTNDFAVSIESLLADTFQGYGDAILLVDQGTKSTSSSAGHGLMNEHPYAKVRYEQARRNTVQLLEVLQSGDKDQFVSICESEALQLHALMMSSRPYFVLLAPNSLKIISLIQEFRKTTGLPVSFTIDAGPNIHLLYPAVHKAEVVTFVQDVLAPYCHQGRWIDDKMGAGPLELD